MSTSVSRTRFNSVSVAILCRRKYCRSVLASNMGGRIMLEFLLSGAIARNYNIMSNQITGLEWYSWSHCLTGMDPVGDHPVACSSRMSTDRETTPNEQLLLRRPLLHV